MIISLRWLQDYVDVADYMQKPEALADLLTKAGLEVENIDNKAKAFQFVVTGLILEKGKHPNADKLSLCRVSTGEGVVHQIVCGAQNHKTNDRVVVALPGAILPGNFAIKQSVIRGVDSGGMLCSEKELGLAKESNGITILPEDAPIGKPFAEYMGFDDVTFELKVTPNRADCLSHYGLAREVACLLGRPMKKIEPQFAVNGPATSDSISVQVKQPALCPRYAGRLVGGVKVGPSPDWLVRRLQSVGMNSINNVVDVTNYVMLELGQPMHAFDAAELKGKKIVVDLAAKDEKFVTLDGTEKTMRGDELMIRDGERAVALAGVVGGKNSGVTEKTTDIFLEAAYFLPATVRKTSRAHGVSTDSAYRFSRGVDPDNTGVALERATELLLKVAGGIAYSKPYDLYPEPVKKTAVEIKLQTVTDRLGYPVDAAKFADYMRRLGCKVEETAGTFKILPPTFRFDIEQDMDLVEEYARLHGYEHIPETVPPLAASPLAHDAGFLFRKRVGEILQGQNYHQAMNFAFTSEKFERDFVREFSSLQEAGFGPQGEFIRLMNPLSDDLNIMRPTLASGLFRAANYNFHQGNSFGRLFELGPVFAKTTGYNETSHLGMVAWGHDDQLWRQGQQHPLIFEVKATVENLLSALGIKSYQWMTPPADKHLRFLHLGQQVHLQVEGKKIGFIGALHPQIVDDHKLRVPVVLCELDLTALAQGQPRIERFKSISKFPVVQRDLALLMTKDVAAGEVAKEIKKQGGLHITSVEIFDQYAGDKLAADQKSVAYRLRFQDKNATLQDEVIVKAIEQILTHLKQKYSIQVR